MSAPSYEQLEPKYLKLWSEMEVDTPRKPMADSAAKRILAHKDKYQAVETELGVPWFFVGLLHYRESELSFGTHLHNGDSLHGFTHNVPAGRPHVNHGPPFTWQESALDALRMRGFHKGAKAIDSVPKVAYEGEAYNGWGYHYKHKTSAYLWAGTNQHDLAHHNDGMFVRDHVYKDTADDPRVGIMPVLQVLLGLDPSVGHALLDKPKPAVVPIPELGGITGPLPIRDEVEVLHYDLGKPQEPRETPAAPSLLQSLWNALLRLLSWLLKALFA